MNLSSNTSSSRDQVEKLNSYLKKLTELEQESRKRNREFLSDIANVTLKADTLRSKTDRLTSVRNDYQEYMSRAFPQWDHNISPKKNNTSNTSVLHLNDLSTQSMKYTLLSARNDFPSLTTTTAITTKNTNFVPSKYPEFLQKKMKEWKHDTSLNLPEDDDTKNISYSYSRSNVPYHPHTSTGKNDSTWNRLQELEERHIQQRIHMDELSGYIAKQKELENLLRRKEEELRKLRSEKQTDRNYLGGVDNYLSYSYSHLNAASTPCTSPSKYVERSNLSIGIELPHNSPLVSSENLEKSKSLFTTSPLQVNDHAIQILPQLLGVTSDGHLVLVPMTSPLQSSLQVQSPVEPHQANPRLVSLSYEQLLKGMRHSPVGESVTNIDANTAHSNQPCKAKISQHTDMTITKVKQSTALNKPNSDNPGTSPASGCSTKLSKNCHSPQFISTEPLSRNLLTMKNSTGGTGEDTVKNATELIINNDKKVSSSTVGIDNSYNKKFSDSENDSSFESMIVLDEISGDQSSEKVTSQNTDFSEKQEDLRTSEIENPRLHQSENGRNQNNDEKSSKTDKYMYIVESYNPPKSKVTPDTVIHNESIAFYNGSDSPTYQKASVTLKNFNSNSNDKGLLTLSKIDNTSNNSSPKNSNVRSSNNSGINNLKEKLSAMKEPVQSVNKDPLDDSIFSGFSDDDSDFELPSQTSEQSLHKSLVGSTDIPESRFNLQQDVLPKVKSPDVLSCKPRTHLKAVENSIFTSNLSAGVSFVLSNAPDNNVVADTENGLEKDSVHNDDDNENVFNKPVLFYILENIMEKIKDDQNENLLVLNLEVNMELVKTILRIAETQGDLSSFDASEICMAFRVHLEQVMLQEKQPFISEDLDVTNDFEGHLRDCIFPRYLDLWDSLFEFLSTIMDIFEFNASQVAAIYALAILPHDVRMKEKLQVSLTNILSGILVENEFDAEDNLTDSVSSSVKAISNKTKSFTITEDFSNNKQTVDSLTNANGINISTLASKTSSSKGDLSKSFLLEDSVNKTDFNEILPKQESLLLNSGSLTGSIDGDSSSTMSFDSEGLPILKSNKNNEKTLSNAPAAHDDDGFESNPHALSKSSSAYSKMREESLASPVHEDSDGLDDLLEQSLTKTKLQMPTTFDNKDSPRTNDLVSPKSANLITKQSSQLKLRKPGFWNRSDSESDLTSDLNTYNKSTIITEKKNSNDDDDFDFEFYD